MLSVLSILAVHQFGKDDRKVDEDGGLGPVFCKAGLHVTSLGQLEDSALLEGLDLFGELEHLFDGENDARVPYGFLPLKLWAHISVQGSPCV